MTLGRCCTTAAVTPNSSVSSRSGSFNVLKPERQRGFEHLDDPSLPSGVALHSLRDIALANRWFGGTRAILAELRPVFDEFKRTSLRSCSLLDVGTGLGDTPVAVVHAGKANGISVTPVGLELTPAFSHIAHQRVSAVITGDARMLPLADKSVDIVTCSLVLHHLDEADSLVMLRECDRVARHRVIIAELERSWLAIVLLWIVSFPLRFHPISRHDGVVSIRRGFLVGELQSLIERATHADVRCRPRLGWRVTASWKPGTKA